MKRDSITWIQYTLLAFYGYFLVAMGPITPFLQGELDLSNSLAGLHPSLFAAGLVIMSLVSTRLIRRFGRQRLLWASALVLAIGSLAVSLAPIVWLSLPAYLVTGLGAGQLIILVQAILADHHGAQGTIALSEANLMAGVAQTVVPLLIGGLVAVGFSWRWALVLPLAIIFPLFIRFRNRVHIPTTIESESKQQSYEPLPKAFKWAFMLLILLTALESALLVWSTSYVSYRLAISPSSAALAFSLFTAAYIAGRIVGTYLSARIALDKLIMGVLLINLAVFPLYWLVAEPWVMYSALFLLGMGISNQYPLAMALAIASAPGQSDRASGLIILAGGTGLLLSPVIFGWLGDRVPLEQAHGLVPILLVAALFMVLRWRRSSKRPPAEELVGL